MANGVSSAIRSIIDSFSSAFDVLTKVQDRQRQRKLRSNRPQEDNETARLKHSLRQGPHEIDHEYRRGLHNLGEHYARGDGQAQTHLTEILLKLNTGLVSIITSFLEHDKRSQSRIDYGSLTNLSELSRRDSLTVLRQLYQRVSSSSMPEQINAAAPRRQIKPRQTTSRTAAKPVKVNKPMIARVTIEDSAKRPQLAMVKPGAKRRSPNSSSSNLSKAKSRSSSLTAVDSVLSTKRSAPALRPPASRTATGSSLSKIAAASTPQLLPSYRTDSAARPTHDITTSSESRLQPLPRRRTAPTINSIATDSTKLGDIPPQRWAVPYDFDAESTLNRQALQNGWPLRDIDGNVIVKPKKRGFFGLFRKKEVLV